MSATTIAPCAELPPGTAIRFTLKWQLVGLLLMVSHVVLVKQSIFFAPLALLGLAWLYVNAPLAGLIVYLQFLFYQNWIIGLLSQGMEREPTFVMLQGTNFAALVILALIAWTRLTTPAWRSLRPVLVVVVVAIVAASGYFVLGASKEGVTSAAIYYREATSLVFAVLVGLDIGRVYGYRTVGIACIVSAAFCVALSYIELLAPEMYYDATNAVAFSAIKTINDPKFDAFYSAKDIIAHNQVVMFNISGSDSSTTQIRFMGSVMHPISSAYVIASAALVAYSIGFGWWLLVLIPLLLMSAVKGAGLLFMCSMCLWCIWSVSRSRGFMVFASVTMMVAYVTFGLTFGQESGDYHVIGFLGGINGFIADPLGHGIGVGGNLSGNAAAGFKWQNFQQGGASFALESAVGVLLYQMGVAAAAIFAVFIILLKRSPFEIPPYGKAILNRHFLVFIALATVAVNGIFQEEAYAPTAAGFFTLLAAILVANGSRPVERLVPASPVKLVRNQIAHVRIG